MADVIHDPKTDWCACEPNGRDRCDYRMLADAVIEHLDPRDGDDAEVSLCIDAVASAAARWKNLRERLDNYAAELNQNADTIAADEYSSAGSASNARALAEVAEHVREQMDELEI